MKRHNFESLKEKLRYLVAENLVIDVCDVESEAGLIRDLGGDSLDLVQLFMRLEEEFDIEISDEAAEKMIAFKDVLRFVESRGRVNLSKNKSNYFFSGKSVFS